MPTAEIDRARREVESVSAKGTAFSRSVAVRVMSTVLRAYRTGGQLELIDLVKKLLGDTVRDGMIASYLRGALRSFRMHDAVLRLGVYDEMIKTSSRMLFVDVDELESKYQTDALKVLEGSTEAVEQQLRATMNELLEKGAHVDEGVKVLSEKFSSLGLKGLRPNAFEKIFRTQTQLAYGAGRWAADQDPAVQEILWGYEYSTVGDDRVRDSHAELDGVKLPKDDPFWQRFWPPNGWNCRCAAIPLYDEEKPKEAPDDVEPDDGFDFNPAEAMRGGVHEMRVSPDAPDHVLDLKARMANFWKLRHKEPKGSPAWKKYDTERTKIMKELQGIRKEHPEWFGKAPKKPTKAPKAPKVLETPELKPAELKSRLARVEQPAAKMVDWSSLDRKPGEDFETFDARRKAVQATHGGEIGKTNASVFAKDYVVLHNAAAEELHEAFKDVGADMWKADDARKISTSSRKSLTETFSRIRIGDLQFQNPVVQPLTVLDSYPEVANDPVKMARLKRNVNKITKKYDKAWENYLETAGLKYKGGGKLPKTPIKKPKPTPKIKKPKAPVTAPKPKVKPKLKYHKTKSLEEMRGPARKDFDIGVNYSALKKSRSAGSSNAERVGTCFAELERMRAKNPEIAKLAKKQKMKPIVRFMTGNHLPRRSGVGGGYDYITGELFMPVDHRALSSKTLKLGGHSIGENVADIFRHEYGHHLHDNCLGAGAHAKWEGVYSGLRNKMGRVSQYASTDAAEAFAESFCAYTHPKYKRGSLPYGIERFMDNNIRGKK